MFKTVKRILAGCVALALIAGAVASPVSSVYAQKRDTTNAPGTWGSAILIQNIGTATLLASEYSIEFYKTDGTLALTFTPPSTANIAAGATQEFYIPTAVTALAAGQYSGVVSSSVPVKAVVNSSTDRGTAAPWSAFSYEGVDATSTATKLYFPGFYKNYYGFQSELVIQNTGTAAATVQATFYNGHTGAAVGPVALGSIPSYAAVTFSGNDTLFSGLASGTSDSIWGVVVESTNGMSLAGVSNIWTESVTDAGVASYNALTAGSQTLYAAAVYNQYYGFVSSLTIQNLSATETATGVITFSNGVTQNFSIGSNKVAEYFVPNIPGIGTGTANQLLSAKVVATSGSLAGIVNIQRKTRGSLSASDPTNPALGSYTLATAAATSVRVPAVFSNYFGYFTAVTVMNAGTQSAEITLTYADGTTWKQTAGAGMTVNFSHLPGSADNKLGTKQTGGTVSSTQPLVVVIQHNTDSALPSANLAKFSPNDFLFALSGFPVTP